MNRLLKSTICIALILSCTTAFGGVAEAAAQISGKDVAAQMGDTEVKGRIPVASGYSDPVLEKDVNAAISDIQKVNTANASSAGARSIVFDYEVKDYMDYESILIYTTTTAGSAKSEVDSVNVNEETNEIIDINDVMGANGIALANKFISDAIKAEPSKYNIDFGGVNEGQDFYVENGNIVLLFDEYEIAPGASGILKFSMKLDAIKNVSITADEYKVEGQYETKMIPLRKVSEGLGYTVTWDAKTKSATVSKGTFSTTVTVDKNSYVTSTRELEAAPTIVNGNICVPISFFDVVLGASYSVDDDGMITFSKYM